MPNHKPFLRVDHNQSGPYHPRSFESSEPLMTFNEIKDLIQNEMDSVDNLLRETLSSDVDLIEDIAEHIVESGGKRIRPVLVILASKLIDLSGNKPVITANIIELIHTATLLHDDVVDNSDLRRGQKTANTLFGNAASVLTGDFIYSRSFELMCQLEDLKVMEVLAQASNRIAAGEVQQLENCNNPDITVENYLSVIYAKTAKLFEAACHVPGVLKQVDNKQLQALIDFGKHIGTAFQLADDVLDYQSDAETMGKNMGDDLAEGKATLPLIYAMKHGNADQVALIRHAIEQGQTDQVEAIVQILNETGALDHTQECAEAEADKAKAALECLPKNQYADALNALCDLAVRRKA